MKMAEHMHQRMILAAGLQSGGTTLVSWCFLQRRDTNGVLDMPSDVIQTGFDKVEAPIVWCKSTIASFRWLDLCELYRDLGWRPEPLLIVRDVRATYASLMKKWYGCNGTTAEDPPLRMRFRRFLRDWELFRREGWPVLKYEDLIFKERAALMEICRAMSLDWDEGMATWPKRRSEIAYVGGLNKTFASSMESGSLAAAKLPDRAAITIDGVPKSELEWLEEAFAAYNLYHGYPLDLSQPARSEMNSDMPIPRYEGTARDWVYSENRRLKWENESLHDENERLKRSLSMTPQAG